ncbi:energy-coupling factor ABC transporter ATP-binding protein [Nocardioidaceae bacterium]|nr:energy-coupling factor ABC transporter ATP-binding protein [Nocardioidaceae bacterium]
MLIELDDVSHHFGDGPSRRQVLREVAWRGDEARIGVIGANGSGKSTLARLLNGLVLPADGHVRLDGLDTRRRTKAVRRRVGFCFTDPDSQIVMPTVAEDLAFGLRRRLPKEQVEERVRHYLERFGLTEHRDHPAHLLSGGQKQLLALASVLVTEPDLLVMDEPTTLLDLRNAAEVSRVVAGLEQQVVLVTHQLDLLADFDRVLVVHEGRVVEDDAPAAAIASYRELMSVDGAP